MQLTCHQGHSYSPWPEWNEFVTLAGPIIMIPLGVSEGCGGEEEIPFLGVAYCQGMCLEADDIQGMDAQKWVGKPPGLCGESYA